MSTQPEYAELERRLAEVINKHQYSDDGMCCSCGLGFDGEAWGYENHLVRMQLPIITLFVEAKEAGARLVEAVVATNLIHPRTSLKHDDHFSSDPHCSSCRMRTLKEYESALATALQNWKEGAR